MASGQFSSMPVQDPSSSLSLEQLTQFRSTMEQLLRCQDSQQLDLVKRVVGNDLLQQVQSKLVQQPHFSHFDGNDSDSGLGLQQQQQQQQQQPEQYIEFEEQQQQQQQHQTLNDNNHQ
jgi:hypothetical protein